MASSLESAMKVAVSAKRSLLAPIVLALVLLFWIFLVPLQQRRLDLELLTEKTPSLGEHPKGFSFPPVEPSRPTASDSLVVHFNAGHGTTGTRSFFQAICSLGIASVHFEKSCFPEVTPAAIQNGLEAHKKAMTAWLNIRICIRSSECTFDELLEIVDSIKRNISEVIAAGIGINDSPYPCFPLFVIELASKQGIVPFVEQTKRDPQEWAESRMHHHPNAAVCKEFFAWDQPERLEYGGLDIDYCLHLAKQRHPHPPKLASDVVMTFSMLLDEAGDNTTKVEQIRRNSIVAFDQAQQILGRYASYKINFWERPVRVTTDDIAKEVSTTAISLNVPLPERSVSFVMATDKNSIPVELWDGE